LAIGGWPEQKMEMIGQQTKSQQADLSVFAGFGQESDKSIVVAYFVEDSTATVATIHDVVAVASQGVACRTWHGESLSDGSGNGNINVPCPLLFFGHWSRVSQEFACNCT
jgi:hypothetical protein